MWAVKFYTPGNLLAIPVVASLLLAHLISVASNGPNAIHLVEAFTSNTKQFVQELDQTHDDQAPSELGQSLGDPEGNSYESINENLESTQDVDFSQAVNGPQSSSTRHNLTRERIVEICGADRGLDRALPLESTYLKNCTEYPVSSLVTSDIFNAIREMNFTDCNKTLDSFRELDAEIEYFYLLFDKLLSRYNCLNGYSVKWGCQDCRKAYKDWLCATHLPFFANGRRIKPCISFCERVEQRCPYLHPIMKEQYGGQPVFICQDPNIPFVPTITPDIPYSEPPKCYDPCHLKKDFHESITESLSKYDNDVCSNITMIALNVSPSDTANSTKILNELKLVKAIYANQSKEQTLSHESHSTTTLAPITTTDATNTTATTNTTLTPGTAAAGVTTTTSATTATTSTTTTTTTETPTSNTSD